MNTYARRKWKLIAPRFRSFKKFRESSQFGPVAKDISDDTKRVMQHCLQVDSGFKTLNISNLLDKYAIDGTDYNDQVITELCKNNAFTLITNDRDFKTQEIPILTINRHLLRQ